MFRRLSSFGPESHERMGVENTVKSVLESQGTNIRPGQLTFSFGASSLLHPKQVGALQALLCGLSYIYI